MRHTLQTSSGDGVSVVIPPRRLRMSRELRRNLVAYAFLTPWLLGLLIFSAGPILASAYLSLTRYDLLSPPEWRGLTNYVVMFTRDPRFAKALQVTANYVLVSVPLQLALALAIALVLNRGIRALSLYRAIYYLPSLLGGSIAIAILWRQVFGLDGLINRALSLIGIQGISWIATPETAVYTLVLLRVWQFGSPMIIFLAGLKSLPSEMMEAAYVDGASRTQAFFYITLPMLLPVIFIGVLLRTMNAFKVFDIIFATTGGGPGNATSVLNFHIYKVGLTFFDMGYAASLANILLFMIGACCAVYIVLLRRQRATEF